MSFLKSTSNGVHVPSASSPDDFDEHVVSGAYVPPTTGVFFWDDFSSQDKSKSMNGFSWGVGNSVVSSDNKHSGTHSLKFTYDGSAPSNGGNNEQNFTMGGDYNETYVRFMIYIPDGTEHYGGAAYSRHTDGSTDNHKFLYMWGNWPDESGHAGYNSGGKNLQASTWPSNTEPSPRTKPSFVVNSAHRFGSSIITEDDLGTWVEIQTGVKSSTTPTATDGFVKLWKNGVLMLDYDNFSNYVSNDRPDYIRNEGYLLGAANGGFYGQTFVFIDEITFSTEFIT